MKTPLTFSVPPSGPDHLLDRVLVNAFLENVPDGVYFKDRDSRFIAVSRSKARRHGVDPADLVGKSDADLFGEQHAQWARVDEESIMSTGEPVIGKLERLTWPDGRQTWAQSTKMPLRDHDGEVIGTLGMSRDVTQDQEMHLELEKAKRHLLDASRTAGMAEVATGVLHNVGNVLTSLNVSASVIASTMHQSRAESLAKLSALLRDHADDLPAFITHDPKGKLVPEFLDSLARHVADERDRLLTELASLQENIDHIKEIVSMQQAYATTMGVTEPLDATMLMEDALRMNAGALVRHDVRVQQDFQVLPPVLAEKSKVLQILVNLIRNAKYAADEGGGADKVITLRVEPGSEGYARLVVADNGIGISPANLSRIFEHGFTTRASAGGHGFGLHSAVNVAREMKGTLTVHSAGVGQGATFTLELPLAPEGAIPTNAYCMIPR
jgi:PAS domain S-box-containing protein